MPKKPDSIKSDEREGDASAGGKGDQVEGAWVIDFDDGKPKNKKIKPTKLKDNDSNAIRVDVTDEMPVVKPYKKNKEKILADKNNEEHEEYSKKSKENKGKILRDNNNEVQKEPIKAKNKNRDEEVDSKDFRVEGEEQEKKNIDVDNVTHKSKKEFSDEIEKIKSDDENNNHKDFGHKSSVQDKKSRNGNRSNDEIDDRQDFLERKNDKNLKEKKTHDKTEGEDSNEEEVSDRIKNKHKNVAEDEEDIEQAGSKKSRKQRNDENEFLEENEEEHSKKRPKGKSGEIQDRCDLNSKDNSDDNHKIHEDEDVEKTDKKYEKNRMNKSYSGDDNEELQNKENYDAEYLDDEDIPSVSSKMATERKYDDGPSPRFESKLPKSKTPRFPEERLKARESFTGKSTLSNRSVLSSCPDDGSEAVNVVVRVRPLSTAELQRRDLNTTSFPGEGGLWIEQNGKTRSFSYNVTFEPSSPQEEVFNYSGIKKLVEMAIDGYSCTAFAYGQTGSGKTYTMTGPPDQKPNAETYDDKMGLIPRCFHYLFDILNQKKNINCRITASYLEIYNEQVKDLLNPNHRSPLTIRLSSTKGFYVENLFAVECECIEDLFAVLEEGMRNRAVGSNAVNEYSSRSHSMLTINIASQISDDVDEESFATKLGKLTFVDLAGSEKTKSTGANNAGHLNESNNINRSLLVLGTCISALGDKKRQGHVPYRDSKLTKLLADSLKGNGVTLMISCISPSSSSVHETMNTLRYASRTRHIKSKPVVIMDPREKFILSLKREIKILRQENHYLRQQLNFPVKPKGQLQRENDDRFMQMLKDQKNKGKPNEPGLFEMIQEYMIENDMLRGENTDLHHAREIGRREIEMMARENEKLMNKLEKLNGSISPVNNYNSTSSMLLESDSSFLSISKSSGKPKPSKEFVTNSPSFGNTCQPVGLKKPPHHLPPDTNPELRKSVENLGYSKKSSAMSTTNEGYSKSLAGSYSEGYSGKASEGYSSKTGVSNSGKVTDNSYSNRSDYKKK